MKKVFEGIGAIALLGGALMASGAEGKAFWLMCLVALAGAGIIGGCVAHDEITKESRYTELSRSDSRLYFLH